MAKTNILIVEDERIVADDIRVNLQKYGYEVSAIISSGEEVIKKIEELKPDLILMDIVLEGELDGIEVTEKIHKKYNIPVVYLSAHSDSYTFERVKISGVFGFVLKPFTGNQLHNAIEIALYKHKTEMILKESEEKHRLLLNSIKSPVVALDENMIVLYCNRKYEKQIDLKVKEIVGQSLLKVIPEFEKSKRYETYMKVLSTGKTLYVEEIYKENYWREQVYSTPRGILVIAEDFTEYKKEENIKTVLYKIANAVNTTADLTDLFKSIQKYLGEILDTKNFYIALYNEEKDTISLPYFIDEKDDFTEFPAGKTLTGYIIKNDISLLATEDVMDELIKSGKTESGIGTPPKIWLGVPLKIDKKIVGAIAVQSYSDENLYSEKDLKVLQFVSEQIAIAINHKQTKDKLQYSERRYRNLIETLHEGMAVVDVDENLLYVNDALCEIFGFSREELIGMNLRKIVPENKIDKLVQMTDAKKKGEFTRYELLINRKDGELRNILVSSAPLLDEDDNFRASIGVVLDITDKKRIEKKLEESNKRIDSLLRNILPESVVDELVIEEINDSSTSFPRLLQDVTIVFIDIVKFTEITLYTNPSFLLSELGSYFNNFDKIIRKYGLEKLKTIGDGYMFAGGLFTESNQLLECVQASLDILDFVSKNEWEVRIGMNSGVCIAGLITGWKMIYDVWGITVNLANTIMENSKPGQINVPETIQKSLSSIYDFDLSGSITVSKLGNMNTYFLKRKEQ